MNKFKYYFILLLAGISLVSCSKKDDDDDVVTVPLRDYAVQYKADNDSIEKYLKTNYITVTNSPGTPEDQNAVIKKIVAGDGNVSIWDQKTYPLEFRNVYSDGITYKVYYLTFRKGSGSSPTNTDKIVASYSGNLLDNTIFDSSYGIAGRYLLYPYDASTTDAFTVIQGWSEIFPKFKTGIPSTASNGVITYSDFGAGVMFLPSGLAYYGSVKTGIPAYTPLVFSFKLFDLQRLDHDLESVNGQTVNVPDGVPDYFEDINGDGYLYNFLDTVKYPNPPTNLIDDTDSDGIPDFLDFDDDGDGYKTRFEITKPDYDLDPLVSGLSKYYPFDKIDDNPNTPNVDETERHGIPAFSASGTPDYKSLTRLRIHVDKAHHSGK